MKKLFYKNKRVLYPCCENILFSVMAWICPCHIFAYV